LCMQCHHARENGPEYAKQWDSRFGPHHGPQADMLAGTNAIDFGMNIPSSNHLKYVPNACVTCHMADTPARGEPGRHWIGEHTWAMRAVDDMGTPDDTSDDVEVENVAGCRTCHGNINSFADIKAKEDYDGDGNIEAVQDEVRGLMDEVGKMLPPIGDPSIAILTDVRTDPNYTPVQLLAAYNYMFVLEDQSNGIHNFQYAVNLLKTAHAALTAGDLGAGIIAEINDVPNDQGKQVRVAWSQFPGDGVAANPINNYSVWRRVDEPATTIGKVKTVASRSDMLKLVNESNIGERFIVAQDGSWDFVGWVPAVRRMSYSTVVPTLYDSTDAGMRWSVFFVAGHARNQTFETAADSGYSIDNLVPSTPENISLSIAAKSVSFQWDEPIDPDFRFFTIYRSTDSGFDPKGAQPLATLIGTEYTDADVVLGTAYYYRFSTFDFSGNESDFSQEFTATITSIGENGGIPTEYALQQNYPNPFNPETTIEYQLPENGQVRLTVYTVLGAPIRVLVDRYQPTGSYKIVWDGRDNVGNHAPSGVYFYRIESGNFSTMKKMIMMK
ncbi:MAG: T9SS type A sorting domain-containing protein, partial [bacterium]